MTSPFLNFSFTECRKKNIEENRETITPEVQAISSLMNLTGVSRLFKKEDIYELVKRAQLVFPERDLAIDFFDEDVLIQFLYESEVYNLDLDFLISYIGFEVADVNTNQTPFDSWAINIPYYKQIAGIIAIVGGTLNLDTSRSNVSGQKNNFTIDFGNAPDDIDFTHEHLKKAETFASAILNRIPDGAFERLEREFPNKFLELEMRNAPFKEPIFDFEALPKEKQEILWMHFWPNMEYFNDLDQRDHDLRLIYLAWLWANGFVIDKDLNSVHIDFRIKNFDPEEISEGEDGNNELLNLNMLYNLDELFPLLEDPEVKKLSHRPWENLDIYSRQKSV
ncbi:hypothetical protein [Salegentibacter maritimus]|uniref:DUF4274 domain-containing protein n=1 Tax=Salegentibacter maritimus TaxID=2794347 RepID=A0ABS0TM12_9FLAO|nr:hypothetical protein [Salegentibacter maritimus]MBI6121038.1 hypothetical protein [Salegentibacter maritimus]